MTNEEEKIELILDADSAELLESLATETGLTRGEIIAKLLPAHHEELWAYREWLRSVPPSETELHSRGVLLIHNYGPGNLIDDIAQIDPTFRAPAQQFKAELAVFREAGRA